MVVDSPSTVKDAIKVTHVARKSLDGYLERDKSVSKYN